MRRPMADYSCDEVVDACAFDAARDRAGEALSCDAYPEELRAAAQALEELAVEARHLALRLRQVSAGGTR